METENYAGATQQNYSLLVPRSRPFLSTRTRPAMNALSNRPLNSTPVIHALGWIKKKNLTTPFPFEFFRFRFISSVGLGVSQM